MRVFPVLSALFLLSSALVALAPTAAALVEPNPTNTEWVLTELEVAQPDLLTLEFTGAVTIRKYVVEGTPYSSSDDIGNAYQQLVDADAFAASLGQSATRAASFVSDIERTSTNSLRSTLEQSFPGAAVEVAPALVDVSTLSDPSGDPHLPGVSVAISATVTRTPADLGLGDYSLASIDAVLQSGGVIAADFDLAARAGHAVTYVLAPPARPAGTAFSAPTAAGGIATIAGGALRVEVDNSAGSAARTEHVSASLTVPTAARPTAEDIRSTIDVTLGDPRPGEDGVPMSVVVDAKIRALDVEARFPGSLPEKVTLPFVNADGVRALRSAGALSDEDVSSANDALINQVRADIQRAFGGDPVVAGGLSAADMTPQTVTSPYTDARPLTFGAFSNVSYDAGASGDDIDLAMRIGGTASVDLKLFSANGRETTFLIHPPAIGVFSQADGGSVSANGKTATFTVPAGATDHEATVSLRGDNVPEFTEDDSEIQITVDLKDLDVTTGKALGGDLGNLVVELTVTGNLNVIEVPDDLKGSLPEDLELTHLSSDAIRLLIDRGKITDENMTKLEESLTKTVTEKLGAALGGEIPVTGTFDPASLQVNLVQTPISSDEPIVFRATAKFLKPMSGGDIQPQAAIALYTTSLPLTLAKIEGRDTVYTIIAPKGLALTGSTAGEISKAPDGRDQLTVRPTSDSQSITLSMAVTPGFVFAKFWPIVLLVVVLLVLIIGTPVALVMRSRGKKKKAAAPPKK